MKTNLFKKKSQINAPVETVFNWHARPGAIKRLSPPWDPLEVIHSSGGIHIGAQVVMKMKAGPIHYKWHARHIEYEKNSMFKDIQISGPFSKWVHTHRFEPIGNDRCLLEDTIEYALPFHPISTVIMDGFVQKKLNRIFTYRHHTTIDDIAGHQSAKQHGPLTILLSGASGLIGSTLIPFLTTGGHNVLKLVRRPPDKDKNEIYWDPASGKLDLNAIAPIDIVIHLSGENIGEGRWTKEKKKRIINSRVKSTRLIAETISKMETPPKAFLCASAIGYYGNRGNTVLTEADKPGDDFISDVCRMWEKSADAAAQTGIRTVFLRFGIVLSPQGGALGKLLLPFQLGMGGKISSGRQFMSWIGIDDAVGAIHHTIFNDQITGPVNLVSPHPSTNKEFTRILSNVLSRPSCFTIPKKAIEIAFGKEMGRETILSSTRVKPAVLEKVGYQFRHPGLASALAHLLGKNNENLS